MASSVGCWKHRVSAWALLLNRLAIDRRFEALGKPNLFFGVAAGNMDSMINRYTADKKRAMTMPIRPAMTVANDRIVRHCLRQRCREAYRDVPVILGGIEASLRRIAHFDYWSDNVRRSILLDSEADLLLYGNAERAIVEIAHRLAAASRS